MINVEFLAYKNGSPIVVSSKNRLGLSRDFRVKKGETLTLVKGENKKRTLDFLNISGVKLVFQNEQKEIETYRVVMSG